jgi:hypothetical protein
MTFLSRLTKLGLAKETTQWTYLAPTVSIPFSTAAFEDIIPPLRDESIRANDAVLQGIQQGPRNSTWDLMVNGYADITGHWLRAIIGPDTVTAGVSTVLSSNTSANASSISLTASPAANAILQISDTAGANLEYVQIGTPTGSGPYVCPITVGGGTGGNTTRYAHTAAGGSVISQTKHTFAQNRSFATVWPTYSLTTDDGADQLGWPGCVMSELGIKIDPKGFVTMAPKYTGFPSLTEATFAYAASTVQPLVGWAWTVQNAGASSTRGMTMDFTLKRAVEALFLSTGSQSPREVFPGALESDGTYKAIFENSTDMNLFTQAQQLPTVHTLTQPVLVGGAILAITMSQSGYTTGKRDLGTQYVSADFALSGINNTTDTGVTQVALSNFVTTQY